MASKLMHTSDCTRRYQSPLREGFAFVRFVWENKRDHGCCREQDTTGHPKLENSLRMDSLSWVELSCCSFSLCSALLTLKTTNRRRRRRRRNDLLRRESIPCMNSSLVRLFFNGQYFFKLSRYLLCDTYHREEMKTDSKPWLTTYQNSSKCFSLISSPPNDETISRK